MTRTDQTRTWQGTFGKEYTDRNPNSPEELDALYERSYGRSRSELNRSFLRDFDRATRILEVGANVGTQLACLERMGFSQLTGLELQAYAIQHARTLAPSRHFVQGSALDLPFGDRTFDLVFTSGVLIHIHPRDLARVVREIHRVSACWIWGLEYYAATPTAIPYRGHDELLWKMNYATEYLTACGDLELVREERLPYLEGEAVDSMYLLRRATGDS